MKKLTNQIVLRRDDYDLLISFLNAGDNPATFDRRNADELIAELRKAKLVLINDFPMDVVRLNSKVKLKTEGREAVLELMLVTPDKANIKENKISVMAPVGTALIGFREGQKVKWRVQAGNKMFTIVEVINQHE